MSPVSYKPTTRAKQSYAEMQRIAKIFNMSLKDTATEMGFDCPYSWQQALLKTVFAKPTEELKQIDLDASKVPSDSDLLGW